MKTFYQWLAESDSMHPDQQHRNAPLIAALQKLMADVAKTQIKENGDSYSLAHYYWSHNDQFEAAMKQAMLNKHVKAEIDGLKEIYIRTRNQRELQMSVQQATQYIQKVIQGVNEPYDLDTSFADSDFARFGDDDE